MSDSAQPRVSGSEGPPIFSFWVRHDGDDAIVYTSGELDIASASRFADAIEMTGSIPDVHVIIDVSQLTFLDAAGISAIVAAHERLLQSSGHGLSVREASGVVRRVFEITGLVGLLSDPDGGGPPASGDGAAADQLIASLEPGELDIARRESGLSVEDHFVAYVALGGTGDLAQLAARLSGDPDALDEHQRDIAAHALNERLAELGLAAHRLSYRGDRKQKSS